MYTRQKFDRWKTALKILKTVALTNLAIELARLDIPTTTEEWQSRGAQVAATLALGVARGIWNTWKTRAMPGNPFYNLVSPWMALILIPTLALNGCVGMTPALGGKTKYTMDFVDTTADQNTEFHVDIAAPAGIEIENLVSMGYRWQPDGSGSIDVAGDTAADTTLQAATIAEVNAQQVQAFIALLAILPSLTPLLQALRPPPEPAPTPGVQFEAASAR